MYSTADLVASTDASLDLTRLTTLAWFGVEADKYGHLVTTGSEAQGWAGWTGPAFAALKDRAQAVGVRVVLTIERFSWTSKQAHQTIALLSVPGRRTALAQAITTAVTDAGADGVNLDFEPLPAAVRDDFTIFVRELRLALDAAAPGMQITFDTTAGIDAYDIPALVADDAADAMMLMGYDYRGNSSAIAGSNDPLDDPNGPDLRESVDQLLALASPDRVILGLPWYGRAWSTVSTEAHAATRGGSRVVSPALPYYSGAISLAQQHGRNYDATDASAWTTYELSACSGCKPAYRQLWYDDADAFGAKIDLAIASGLRGIGIWALGYNGAYPELWSALGLRLGDIVDTEPPSGTATLDSASVRGKKDGLPLVGEMAHLALTAKDGPGGSGVALVRLSNAAEVGPDGALIGGQDYPSVDGVDWSLRTGLPALPPLKKPRATPTPSPDRSADPSQSPEPTATPTTTPGRRSINVQWRDVAGNWSAPVEVGVWYRPGTSPTPSASSTPSPSPSSTASTGPSASGAPGSASPIPFGTP
jgi:spore germination protein YaaH